jgi:hypothetical protein
LAPTRRPRVQEHPAPLFRGNTAFQDCSGSSHRGLTRSTGFSTQCRFFLLLHHCRRLP